MFSKRMIWFLKPAFIVYKQPLLQYFGDGNSPLQNSQIIVTVVHNKNCSVSRLEVTAGLKLMWKKVNTIYFNSFPDVHTDVMTLSGRKSQYGPFSGNVICP